MKYKYLKKSIFIILLVALTTTLFSCTNDVVDSLIDETPFIPEAANQFAIDKETEVETNEPTKAHREWPSDFKLAASKEVIIGEKQFLTKINYIYNHIDAFKDSTIVVEGMYGKYTSWDETFKAPIVYRNGPSEYGDDQYAGFFLVNINENQYNIDDWIRVRGMPFMYEHVDTENETQYFMFLLVENIDVLSLKERKAEMMND